MSWAIPGPRGLGMLALGRLLPASPSLFRATAFGDTVYRAINVSLSGFHFIYILPLSRKCFEDSKK